MFNRQLVALCAFIALLFCITETSSAQQVSQKIGFIDLQRIYAESSAFTQVSDRLQAERDRRQEELKKKQTQIISKIDEFQISREMLPEQTAEQRMKELQQEQQQFMREMQTEQIELEQLKDESLKPLIEKLRNAVETAAKEGGYSIILKKFYIGYGAPEYDITDKVIAALK